MDLAFFLPWFIPAHQHQRIDDMLFVGRTILSTLCIISEIIITVGKSQSALPEIQHLLSTVLVILTYPGHEGYPVNIRFIQAEVAAKSSGPLMPLIISKYGCKALALALIEAESIPLK